ncbi:MAG TPA: ATP-binding cassette domain-containing protein [Opitutaceae bacterium]|nr:ATP-binding cassette domain-containing protein [Opitutaceae bacterium]
MNAIIQADSLSRFYGMILGLNNVTFTIRPGITGVVGPNGAGKTTLFRLLLGQIRPSAGTLAVFDASPWNNPAVQARLAYCPEGEQVPRGLHSLEWLVGLGMISGLSAREARARAGAALERVKLAPEHWKKQLTACSKGMKQRIKLAQCLLHEPQLVILDEPMNGLDPMGREDIGNILRGLARDGTSVLISSHILHDLEALCADFILLRWGRIPRSLNEAASADARTRWPDATTFRCASPEKLARYLFGQDLLRGCDIVAETGTLHARWREPERFYGDFHRLLLESGVPIFEVQTTASFLENAMEPATHS